MKWWVVCTLVAFLPAISVFSQHLDLKSPSADITVSASGLSTGNIHIVAVMAEFQQEENRFTTGDGTFNPEFLNRDDIFIDPLPHDKAYFEAHLLFAKNYFKRVSGGQLSITYEVIPQIVTLPNPMAAYSPIGEDSYQNDKLAFLARDAWSEVELQGLFTNETIDPDRTMFIVFHAGSGRNLELVGTTLTKTPQDIPSVYLSQNSFERLLDNPGFNGFPINNSISVKNTAILPETQSRPGEDILGNEFVLELSINGLLTAMIGSYIGLPDLFNTETGRSGIGRFGLMDGAGFFSYYGLFPPEPSAWEKIYLGWQTPFDISETVNQDVTITLPAAVLREPNSIAIYPISTDEYFLIENRHRDPNLDGVSLTIQTPDGNLETFTITNDEDRFNPFDLSRIGEILPAGVLVDVSNFDWSLPGGLDVGEDQTAGTDDDRLLNGGILIWHIDEQVIRKKMDDNAINNDPLRRGVKLVEADAAQDIGRPAGGLTNYEQGGPFDFWWAGNDFTVINTTGQRFVLYQNRFADDTTPNNRSNTGSRTYFEFYDFSDNLPMASFRAKRVIDSDIRPLSLGTNTLGTEITQFENHYRGYPLSTIAETSGNDTLLIIPSHNETRVFNITRNLIQSLSPSTPHQPLLSDGNLVIAQNRSVNPGSNGDIYGYEFNSLSGEFEPVWQTDGLSAIGLLSQITAGNIQFDRTTQSLNLQDGQLQQIFVEGNQTINAGNTFFGQVSGSNIVNAQSIDVYVISGNETDGNRLYVAGSSGSDSQKPNVFILWTDEQISTIDAQTGSILSSNPIQNYSWPIVTDFNNDGSADIIFINYDENIVEARNVYGAMLDGFPITAPKSFEFEGSPLVVPASNDNSELLIIPANDSFTSVLLVYEGNLRSPVESLLVGPTRAPGMPVNPVLKNGVLFAVSAAGDIKGWQLSHRADAPSAYIYGDPANHKIGFRSDVGGIGPANGSLLRAAETYNWPNPARDYTNIRVETSESAEITVTVINYGGQKLLEKRASTQGNLPQELNVDTSGWSNGVYFCRVTARAGGKTEHKVITMVVIR